MRGLAVLSTLLVLVALLAGCSDAPKQAADEPAATGTGGGGRVARGGHDSGDDDSNETDLRSVELLHAPLQMAGPASESFDVQVPPGVVSVSFLFTGGTTFDSSGLHVELSGCGAYDQGVSFAGVTGGGYGADLCGTADAGPQTVTVSGALVVFDGQFIVTAYVPANATT